MIVDRMFPLRCSVQHYPWGAVRRDAKPPLIADLLGMEAEAGQPFAELWMGAHPGAPAVVALREGEVPLHEFIARDPERILGKLTVKQLGDTLSFLCKILSCDKPLSIQAHPDKQRAAKLHEKDPEHYPDPNHKPEVAIALREFYALSGFRPMPEIAAEFERLTTLDSLFMDVPGNEEGADEAARLRALWAHLFEIPQEKIEPALADLSREIDEADGIPTPQDSWLNRLLADFPGDRGALAVYFLNLVHLSPGQAFFMGPNEPHAYLSGTIVECMANSDNVVRAGLTKKSVDREVLVEMLDYTRRRPPEILSGEQVSTCVCSYRVPVEEFQVDMITGQQKGELALASGAAASILLVLQGKARFETPDGVVEAERGSIWFWPAALTNVKMRFDQHDTQIVRSRPNVLKLVQHVEVVEYDTNADDIDFGALLDGGAARVNPDPKPGDKVSGRVSSIDRSTVFVDIGAKSEGVLDAAELTDKDGTLKVDVGDPIDAFCLNTHNGIRLTTRMSGDFVDYGLQDAFEAEIPVEGKVVSERKGGFEVQVGNSRAFCPYSQIDTGRRDAALYIGQRLSFLITEYSEKGRNLVLSRRRLLERDRKKEVERLKTTLSVGDVVPGRVVRVLDFGAFVDIGGTEGLIPVSEFSWSRVERAADFISEGEEVQVMVREIDWDRERISLSLKRAGGDPWADLVDRYDTGATYEGTVTRLEPFGAFVELEPGIEGLVHISKLGAGRRINHPKEVVATGQQVEVTLEEIDEDRHRLSLSMESRTPDLQAIVDTPDTDVFTGTVNGTKEYGAFISLSDGRSGLLHISEMKLEDRQRDRQTAVDAAFPVGSQVKVVVKEVKRGKVSLALPPDPDENPRVEDFVDTGEGDLGSLGSLFDGLNLK